MENNTKKISISELSAILYLTIPVLVFFLFFIRVEIALFAAIYMLYMMYGLVKKTDFHIEKFHLHRTACIISLSIIFILLSGAGRFLYSNGDWIKHYAVLNFLVDNSWPAEMTMPDGSREALRYYLGWYLVPATFIKIVGGQIQDFAMSLWVLIGLTTFFSLVANFFPNKIHSAFIPVLFLLFSGMDIVGTAITNTWNAEYHLEWWAGWMQYPSMLAALFWAPQHAIPAWIGIALFMAIYRHKHMINNLVFLSCCILLSSPFVAIGLIPFALAICFRFGFKASAIHWQSAAALIFIALPIMIYLSSSTGNIPHGIAWNTACTDAKYCFSITSYVLVMLLEVIPFLIAAYFLQKPWRYFSVAAGGFLAILPFYHMGSYNDLVMRASLPALSFLAIMIAVSIVTQPKKYSILLSVLIVMGTFTPGGEILRAFVKQNFIPPQIRFSEMPDFEVLRLQYFSPEKIPVIREE